MNSTLFIFDTHPIQYRAPVFRALAKRLPGLKVFFFDSAFDGKKWWFQEVDKIPRQDFGLPLEEGYSHSILGTRKMGFFQKWGTFKKILTAERPEAILIYGYYQVEHWILRMLSNQLNIPLIFVGETFDWRGSFFRKMIKKVLISRFFQKVNEFISIGNKTFQYYQSWGISPVLITKANYCTDPSGFLLGEKEAQFAREQIRKQLNIPQDDFVMLFVGRLFERKRPHDLLRIHQLLDRFKKVHTLIVGNGELSEELKKQSQNLSRVYFPGFQNQKEIKNFYYAADILVVPSEFETWGLVVNEAFACGLPALVTSTCGSAEDLVIPNENGAIFPVGDCNSASQTIERLLVEPNLARVWGTNARKRVLENYTPSHFAASIMTAFQKAISKSI